MFIKPMQATRRIHIKDGDKLLRLVAAAGTASACIGSTSTSQDDEHPLTTTSSRRKWAVARCEAHQANPNNALPSTRPSWISRSLAYLKLTSLPVPRLLTKGDPAFRMEPRLLHKRQLDEVEMQNMVRGALAVQERNPKALQELNDKCLELAYGQGMTLKKRQDFVHRHGCTAWTDEVLDTILELGKERGVVEIGCGNGQWARALMERYKQTTSDNNTLYRKKKFDFVLAYDDQSDLPLDQQVFNKKTKIHHDYFYDKVQRCGKDFNHILKRFECRGRILLLVYPPPGPMAIEAVQQYTSASERNDTVMFVGEGRGGANANEELFDLLENGEWVLLRVLQVKPLGSKGYEQLYILKRNIQGNAAI